MNETDTLPTEIKLGTAPTEQVTGATTALAFARTMIVNTDEGYQLAAEELKGVKRRSSALEEARMAMKRPIIDAGKKIDAFFNIAILPLLEAERTIKNKMNAHAEEQERIAEEARQKAEAERRRALAEAERKAREEREKAEAEARRQREEADRQKREADEAEKRARAAREAGDRAAAIEADRQRKVAEEAQREAEARETKAIEKGETRADQAMAKAAEVAAQPVVVDVPVSAAGVSRRSTWHAEVVDIASLVKAVSEGRAPMATLIADMRVLNDAAKSLKGELPKFYPGVRAVEKKDLAART